MPSSPNTNALNQLQQQQAQALTAGGKDINKAFSRFNPAYYQGVENQYVSQALPQVDAQARQTGQQLNYKLADQGLSKSSAAQTLSSSLASQTAQAQQQVVNNAQTAAQGQQQNVANEQAQLYGQLQTSQNPTAVAQSAANVAAQTAAPSVFAPIGNLFSNWSNMYLAGQAANTATQNNALTEALFLPYLNNPGAINAGTVPANT